MRASNLELTKSFVFRAGWLGALCVSAVKRLGIEQ